MAVVQRGLQAGGWGGGCGASWCRGTRAGLGRGCTGALLGTRPGLAHGSDRGRTRSCGDSGTLPVHPRLLGLHSGLCSPSRPPLWPDHLMTSPPYLPAQLLVPTSSWGSLVTFLGLCLCGLLPAGHGPWTPHPPGREYGMRAMEQPRGRPCPFSWVEWVPPRACWGLEVLGAQTGL